MRLLRAVLARELDTINEYEEMAERAEDPHIRGFFAHLALEEKEHVAEALKLIHERDPEQERASAVADVGAAHFRGASATRAEPVVVAFAARAPAAREGGARAELVGGALPAPRFTVGSLKEARGERS